MRLANGGLNGLTKLVLLMRLRLVLLCDIGLQQHNYTLSKTALWGGAASRRRRRLNRNHR